ncbi:protein xpaC [Bacillus lacus]|uniref:Protein xpaC n=2 Tax=Metabacillus lacus TaxID=1983721 RepID=A0A7X2LYL7_9BACI|nr:5-bromo-4-chloroindolyl phosphate hydrolysis family protein [Metabacillus lacus]MRX72486.1 protein xpaC [Metabacillus lacus]
MIAFLTAVFVAVPVTTTVWLVSMFAYGQPFFFSTAIAAGAGLGVYGILSAAGSYRFLKKHGLTRKEYKYIKRNLTEAKGKLFRLNKSLFSMRDIGSIKQRLELVKVARKIYVLTKNEPKRFYQAERFYFSHLDSAVELAEKYAFLSNQPKKSLELKESLIHTKKTLGDLQYSIEKDLQQVIANDVDELHFEIDVARNAISKTSERTKYLDEGRR